jgi:hypothetical protein
MQGPPPPRNQRGQHNQGNVNYDIINDITLTLTQRGQHNQGNENSMIEEPVNERLCSSLKESECSV